MAKRIVGYILDNKKNPVPVYDIIEWGMWFEDATNRIVAQDTLPDGSWISTVFLGLDHSFGGPVPILFETMAFHKRKPRERFREEEYTDRYATWKEAVDGHMKVIIKILGRRAKTYLKKYDRIYNN